MSNAHPPIHFAGNFILVHPYSHQYLERTDPEENCIKYSYSKCPFVNTNTTGTGPYVNSGYVSYFIYSTCTYTHI
jgi:hypothetical protein